MSKRLFIATVGVVLGMLATNANARPQDWTSPQQSEYSESNDDGDRQVRRSHRRQSGKATRQRDVTERNQRRSTERRGSSRHAGAGTSRSCLAPSARALLGRIESKFGAMQIISTCRPGATIAGSGRRSKHADGLAIDFNAGRRKGEVVRWLIASHKSGGTMTYAGMSHIHVDIGPHFVSLGSHNGG